jgi:hypothetical protein
VEFSCRSFIQNAQQETNDKCNREPGEPSIGIKIHLE